jgi:hypothetical protein
VSAISYEYYIKPEILYIRPDGLVIRPAINSFVIGVIKLRVFIVSNWTGIIQEYVDSNIHAGKW